MATISITQTDDAANSYSGNGVEWFEFIPFVELRNPTGYNIEEHELPLVKDENDQAVRVDLLIQTDDDQRSVTITSLKTELERPVIPFSVKKGGSSADWLTDEDGYIEVELSKEMDTFVEVKGVTAKIKDKSEEEFNDSHSHKIFTTLGSEIDVEINISANESTAFYLRFLANDNEETFSKGSYENLFCGCFKVSTLNEWEFSETQIEKIKRYAVLNNSKLMGSGDANRYHHCTDTHKHIVYKLLENPPDLGKDQDHEAVRLTPMDFENAGEATTDGVRSALIAQTYAEPSKIFTVIDINDNEVIGTNGKPGNTDKQLKKFKESPIEYMKSKCPDNGYYIFIGAYNDDYHSFTIIVNKKDETFNFQFVDQLVAVVDMDENSLENLKLLSDIRRYRSNFPMGLELYQLRNKMK